MCIQGMWIKGNKKNYLIKRRIKNKKMHRHYRLIGNKITEKHSWMTSVNESDTLSNEVKREWERGIKMFI